MPIFNQGTGGGGASLSPIIVVSAPTGSTVTCKKGFNCGRIFWHLVFCNSCIWHVDGDRCQYRCDGRKNGRSNCH